MTLITPGGSETPAYFQITKADKLSNSSGTKKLRVDLVSLFGAKPDQSYGNGRSSLDKSHHLSIALQDDKIYDALPSKGLFGRGVVVELPSKEAEVVPSADLAAPEEGGRAAESEAVPPGKQYIVLNVNSLAKRLGVSPDLIKDKEGEGTEALRAFIQQNLDKITEGQEIVSQVASKAKKGKASDPALSQDQKTSFTRFIQSHFEAPYLHQNAENFLTWTENVESIANHQTEIKTFLAHLETKIWWSSDKLKPTSRMETNSFYIGSAISHSGRAGRLTERMCHLSWDTKGRYAVAGRTVKEERLLPLRSLMKFSQVSMR